MNKNIRAGIAGSLLATSMLTPNTANAEGEMIDAYFKSEDRTCALGNVAMDLEFSELISNSGDQSEAPNKVRSTEPNVAVIETPVGLVNYTDSPAKFILKSVTDNKYGHYVTKDKVRVKAGEEKSTSIYTATANSGTYKLKVRAKGLGPINSTENINVSDTCK